MNQPFYAEKLDLSIIRLDISERINSKSDLDLIRRLSAFYQKMISDQKNVEKVWLPDGEWKNYNEEKSFLYNALLENDYSKSSYYLNNFWRNKLGLIVKEYATFETLSEGNPEKVNLFLQSILRNYIIWKDLYGLDTQRLKLLAEVGNPWGMYY